VSYTNVFGNHRLRVLDTSVQRRVFGPDLRGRKWQEASLLSNGYRGALSLVVKRPGREAGHLPPSSAEIKDCVELYFHSPNTISWRGAQFKKRTETTLLSLS